MICQKLLLLHLRKELSPRESRLAKLLTVHVLLWSWLIGELLLLRDMKSGCWMDTRQFGLCLCDGAQISSCLDEENIKLWGQ